MHPVGLRFRRSSPTRPRRCPGPRGDHRACHRWRPCRLDPTAIVHTFLLQVLHGNVALPMSPGSPAAASPPAPSAGPAPGPPGRLPVRPPRRCRGHLAGRRSGDLARAPRLRRRRLRPLDARHPGTPGPLRAAEEGRARPRLPGRPPHDPNDRRRRARSGGPTACCRAAVRGIRPSAAALRPGCGGIRSPRI
jgi:hypothetical protein